MKISKIQKVKNLFWSLWLRAKTEACESFQKNCPIHIPRKLPITSKKCTECGKPLKIFAYWTGDGYVFEWECENGCAMHPGEFERDYPGWWPFLFGVWATSDQLRKIGIEEL